MNMMMYQTIMTNKDLFIFWMLIIMEHKLYKIGVKEPWFSLIKLGLKSVEGRKNKGLFYQMKIGDIIEWQNDDFGHRTVMTRVIKKQTYPTFKKYLENETLTKCLPGFESVDSGLDVYYSIYTKEDEQKYGVVAIHMELIK